MGKPNRSGSTVRTAAIGLALVLSSIGHAAILPAEKRTEAADFSLLDAESKPVRLSDLKGRVLLINFWATWCHGCQTEIPWLIGFQKKYGSKGLAVVGISMDDDGWKVVRPYLQAKRLNYRVVIGNPQIGKAYGLGTMPRTVLVDRDGRVAAAYEGVVPRASFERDLRQLLDSPEGPRTDAGGQPPQNMSMNAPVDFLLTSAATDFHTHRAPHPTRFRDVRVGHVTARDGSRQYMLCGAFLPAVETGESEWTPFATIKTSGYEQWLGARAADFCGRSSIVWVDGDLSSSLQTRLDSLK